MASECLVWFGYMSDRSHNISTVTDKNISSPPLTCIITTVASAYVGMPRHTIACMNGTLVVYLLLTSLGLCGCIKGNKSGENIWVLIFNMPVHSLQASFSLHYTPQSISNTTTLEYLCSIPSVLPIHYHGTLHPTKLAYILQLCNPCFGKPVTSHAQPVTDPHYWTSLDPNWVRWTSGLLFEPSAPLTFYLLISYTSSSDPTPDSACLWTPVPLRSIIPFILLPYLPYSCLPVCTRFLVPDLDSCPYSLDSDRTSYTDSLLSI